MARTDPPRPFRAEGMSPVSVHAQTCRDDSQERRNRQVRLDQPRSRLLRRRTPELMPETRPLRVLHIITRLIVGGAQENTLLTCEGLAAMPEYDVTLVSGIDRGPEGDLLDRARESVNLVLVPELRRSVNPMTDVRALWKLYRLIRRGRYHIVHTHSSKAGVLGRIAAKLAGTPLIVHTLHSLVFHEYQPWIVNRTWLLVKKICAPMTDHFL